MQKILHVSVKTVVNNLRMFQHLIDTNKTAKRTARDARLLNGPPKKKKKRNTNNGKKLKSIKSACCIISDSESSGDDSSQCFANPCLIRTNLNVEDPSWVCCDWCNE